MKILVAIDHFKEGGAERVASLIINELCLQHEVYVVVLKDEINYPLNFSKIKYYTLGIKGNLITRKLKRLTDYRKIIMDVSPEVILSFANYMSIYTMCATIGYKKKIKIISSERTDPNIEPHNVIIKKIRDYSYGRSDFLVCQTPHVVKYFMARISTKCVVISNPITPCLPKWQGQDSKKVITACRLTEQKNLPLLIKAFSKLIIDYPELKLEIYGEGELRNYLEEYIQNSNLDGFVFLPGFATNIHELMANSYMFVLPSIYEGISNSMLEALGIGIPTICTDCPVGGAAMFINNKINGILTKVNDVDELYYAMKIMYEDKKLSLQCSNKSIEINNILEVNNITQQWVDLIVNS